VPNHAHTTLCTYIYSDVDDVGVCVDTDSFDLVLLPLAPLLFVLYLHLISQVSPSSMPGPTSKSTDIALRHGEYYINSADLIVRVRRFPIEIASLSKSKPTGGGCTLSRPPVFFRTRFGVLSPQTSPTIITRGFIT
jgi:hypothetical protein